MEAQERKNQNREKPRTHFWHETEELQEGGGTMPESYTRAFRKGLRRGYLAGAGSMLMAVGVVALILLFRNPALRMHGKSFAMLPEIELEQTQASMQKLPERYSLVNDDGQKVYAAVYRDVKKCTYDWDGLKVIGNYKYYAPDNKKQCRIGIDVSRYQTAVDWQQVKASGVQFVMIRVGYRGYGASGKIVEDEMFQSHIEGAKAAGLDVGVYFFSQAVTEKEAKEEAEYVLDKISGYDLAYPVAFDSEKVEGQDGRANKLSARERTKIAIAFLERVKKAGYEPMIYANDRWFALGLDLRELDEYKLWLASYRDEPVFCYHMDAWQHTNRATVPGIAGKVDMNIWFDEE